MMYVKSSFDKCFLFIYLFCLLVFCLFICSLFNDTVCDSVCIVLNGWIVVSGELERL